MAGPGRLEVCWFLFGLLLANSSAMVFLSFAVRRSSVIWACCRSKRGKEKGVLGLRERRGARKEGGLFAEIRDDDKTFKT